MISNLAICLKITVISLKKDDTPISFLKEDDISYTDIQTMLGSLKIIESEMNQNIFDCSLGQHAKNLSGKTNFK